MLSCWQSLSYRFLITRSHRIENYKQLGNTKYYSFSCKKNHLGRLGKMYKISKCGRRRGTLTQGHIDTPSIFLNWLNVLEACHHQNVYQSERRQQDSQWRLIRVFLFRVRPTQKYIECTSVSATFCAILPRVIHTKSMLVHPVIGLTYIT